MKLTIAKLIQTSDKMAALTYEMFA